MVYIHVFNPALIFISSLYGKDTFACQYCPNSLSIISFLNLSIEKIISILKHFHITVAQIFLIFSTQSHWNYEKYPTFVTESTVQLSLSKPSRQVALKY